MKQSNVMFFFLFAGFIIYITLKGELPKYLAVLGIGEGSVAAQTVAGVANGLTGGTTASTVIGSVASAASGNPAGAIMGASKLVGSGGILANQQANSQGVSGDWGNLAEGDATSSVDWGTLAETA